MNSTKTLRDHARNFVQALDRMSEPDDAEGRRRLALLRRALQEPDPLIPILQATGEHLADVPEDELKHFVLVAPLVALHKQKLQPGARLPRFTPKAESEYWANYRRRTCFGASVRCLRARLADVGRSSLDLRFGALLNAPYEDLDYYLRQMVQRIISRDEQIPIDYAQLIVDSSAWEHPHRFDLHRQLVQHVWAQAYWQRAAAPAELIDQN